MSLNFYDGTQWNNVGGGTPFKGMWDASKTFEVDDICLYNGVTYKAVSENINIEPILKTEDIYSSLILQDSPSLYLKLDDDTGSTTILDSSGNNRDFSVDGSYSNTAAIFGSSENKAFIDSTGYPVNTTLNNQVNILPTAGFTISFLTKSTVGVGFGTYPQNLNGGMYIWGDGTYLEFGTIDSNGTYTDLSANTGIKDNLLHHVALVWDGTNRYIYIDGVQDATDTPAQGYDAPTTAPYRFVKFADVNNGRVNNQVVSHFSIFPTVLTSTQIASQNTTARLTSGIAAEWEVY